MTGKDKLLNLEVSGPWGCTEPPADVGQHGVGEGPQLHSLGFLICDWVGTLPHHAAPETEHVRAILLNWDEMRGLSPSAATVTQTLFPQTLASDASTWAWRPPEGAGAPGQGPPPLSPVPPALGAAAHSSP